MMKRDGIPVPAFVVPALFFVLLATGCRSASTDSAAGNTTANPAATQQQAAQEIKSNPNLPPEAKAAILRQTQGGRPPGPGGAPAAK